MKLPQIDKDQVEVYKVIFYMFIQFILVVAAIVAFFMVLVRYLDVNTWFDAAKYGAIEAALGGTLYKVYWHYFPSKATSAKTKKIVPPKNNRRIA